MDKATAIRDAAQAIRTATDTIRRHGRDSVEARDDLATAHIAIRKARELGATDDEIRDTRPA